MWYIKGNCFFNTAAHRGAIQASCYPMTSKTNCTTMVFKECCITTRTKVISIHALREEGDLPVRSYGIFRRISIHALREEGDLRARTRARDQLISIHALREEGDQHGTPGKNTRVQFLSTPSARRATKTLLRVYHVQDISIHALREEGDYVHNQFVQHCIQFLSTPSARRATAADWRTMNRTVFLSTPSARRATLHRMAGCR